MAAKAAIFNGRGNPGTALQKSALAGRHNFRSDDSGDATLVAEVMNALFTSNKLSVERGKFPRKGFKFRTYQQSRTFDNEVIDQIGSEVAESQTAPAVGSQQQSG